MLLPASRRDQLIIFFFLHFLLGDHLPAGDKTLDCKPGPPRQGSQGGWRTAKVDIRPHSNHYAHSDGKRGFARCRSADRKIYVQVHCCYLQVEMAVCVHPKLHAQSNNNN